MRTPVRSVRFGHILAGGAALALMLAACSPATTVPPTLAPATEFPTVAVATEAATAALPTEASTTGAGTEIATSAATEAATSAATEAATAEVTANATAAGTAVANAPLLIESDKLIGMSVDDSSGASLGTIMDVLVTTTGTVQAVVLNLNTTLPANGTPAASGTSAAGTPAATSSSATSVATTSATEAATAASTAAATTAATSAVNTPAATVAVATSEAGTPAAGTPVANANTVAVPWTAIMADPTTKQLTYQGTASDLASMTPFDDSMIASGYVVRAQGTSLPAAYDGLLRLGGSLSDIKLQTATNDTIGQVQNVIIDLHTGMATYAVVDVGAFLGVTSQPVLIPIDKFQLDTSDATTTTPVVRLNVTKDSLTSAPKFDETALSFWPTPANNDWDSQIQLFWQSAAS